jgi:hypothetical protein
MHRVATDRQVPYNVFGARQDGPTYRGPSNSLLTTGQIPADLWEYAGWNEAATRFPIVTTNTSSGSATIGTVERYNTRLRSTRDANPGRWAGALKAALRASVESTACVWDLRTQASAASGRGMSFGAPGRDNPYVAPGTTRFV